MQNCFLDAIEEALLQKQAQHNLRVLPKTKKASVLPLLLETKLEEHQNSENKYIFFNGKKLLNLGGNDYLGIGSRTIDIQTLAAYASGGSSGKASRLLSGNHPLYAEFESTVSDWKNCESALVLSSGFMANYGALQALAKLNIKNKQIVFLFDRNVHASLIDGITTAKKALYESFQHNDLTDLQKKIKKHRDRAIVVVSEAIFSMDGDLAPALDLLEITQKHRCFFFFDEAHSHGVIGNQGEGMLGHIPQNEKKHLLTSGTLGKALGGSGAFLCGSRLLIDYLVNFMRPLIFSTALSPLTLACNLQSLNIVLKRQNPGKKLLEKAMQVKNCLGKLNFPYCNEKSPIVPIVFADNQQTLAMQKICETGEYYIPAIRPPTVKPRQARLRMTMNDMLMQHEIDEICDNFINWFR